MPTADLSLTRDAINIAGNDDGSIFDKATHLHADAVDQDRHMRVRAM